MIIVVRKGTELKKTTNYFIVNVRTVSPDFVVIISGLVETVLHSGNGPLVVLQHWFNVRHKPITCQFPLLFLAYKALFGSLSIGLWQLFGH